MSNHVRSLVLLALALTVAFAPEAQACRIIEPIPRPIPIPPRPPEMKPLQTRYHSADITIKDQVAEVTVNATFYNPNPFRIEGTYWFPLPADAAVKDFEMEVNGKVVKGELLDAAKARQIYEDIVRRQKDPALLEWVGAQMLKCRVFPIEANKETKVALSYTYMLQEDAGLVRFSYPLRSAKPNEGTIDQLVVKISLESAAALKTIYSPTHNFDISRKSDKTALLSFEAKNVDPVKDVELLFSRDNADVGLTVISHNPANEAGYFLLTVTPKVAAEDDKVIKKDIIFVCDTSGSMLEGGKIEQAKKALHFCVNSLNPGDRFNIIAFSTEARFFKNGLVERTDDNLKEADAYIDGLTARGGTALNEALLAALDVAKNAKNVPMMIFLTDGLPTVGEQNVQTILKNVKEANAAKCRLFVFGVGYDVNTQLLDLLAEENRGVREYVKPKEDIEVKVSSFYTKVASPVLSDVKLDFGGAEVEQVYPRQLPDLFRGTQLTMLGRFKKPGQYRVTLSGQVGDEAAKFTYDVAFKDSASDDYLPRLWALRKVAFLLDEIRLHGENKELVEEITLLGKRHGIITPYTSFLVVEEGAPLPAEVRRELSKAGERSRDIFVREKAGRAAVENSADIARSSSPYAPLPTAQGQQGQGGYGDMLGVHGGAGDEEFAEKLSQAARDVIRQVGAKTFYVKEDGFWVDSTYDKDAGTEVKDVALWSDEFFDLVKQHPELGKILGETQKVIVVIGDEAYRIQ